MHEMPRMSGDETQHSLPISIATPLLVAVLSTAGCGAGEAQPPTPEASSQVSSALSSAGHDPDHLVCNSATAGGGWVNRFMPQSDGTFSLVLENAPSAPGTPPQLDAVIGLSNGPAHAFTDLGPIVRFTDYGVIDARDGDHYASGFPYITGVGAFAARLDVNVATHHYDVWVKHDDSPAKPFELLGSNFAFRSEQSGVPRLDNVGVFIDSAQGSVEACQFGYSSPNSCLSSQAGSWVSQGFPVQSGPIRLEFDVSASAASIDAVIGASQGNPTAFSALGPTLRFNPNGTFEARNGATYAADSNLSYAPDVTYRVALDINIATATYSVGISAPYRDPVVIAHDFAFRSEQAHLASLDHLGQFVDATEGTLNVCLLTVEY